MSRNRVVSVRLTGAEYERLRQRADAAGRRVSDQIREDLRHPSSPDTAWIPARGDSSHTAPSAPSSVIWLSNGRQDGATFTVVA